MLRSPPRVEGGTAQVKRTETSVAEHSPA
jgi:hypothetical protein